MAVGGAVDGHAVARTRPHRRRVVADHLQVAAVGQVPKGLGEVEDRVGLAGGEVRKALARVGQTEGDADDLARGVSAGSDAVLEAGGDV
ncbi:hypothetical protein [Actinacidiphila acididurans]|uniref:CsbD-like protein n=1 Tax=Actinacidiphila acididurans TaxID=2784346 RepID=A0ABS2TIL3_9ACTN|nr:hypothetical protein [Actinacidiphila acididurans]MBM9503185.1 hypothetical protein [Actinacidiphila acididurans]